MSDIVYSAVHGEAARRQFRISLFMVTILAIGALILGSVAPQKPTPAIAAFDDGGTFSGRLVVED